jgi:hypothetical protein
MMEETKQWRIMTSISRTSMAQMRAVEKISSIIWKRKDNRCANEYSDYEDKPELDRYEADGIDDEGDYRQD